MMVPFQLSTLPVTPWKNGGGETREIICVPAPDAPFLWRASIATLQADGPFSPFPGVDRVITLLAGQPLRLCGENIDQPLALWQPWASPANGAVQRRDRCARAGLQYHDSARVRVGDSSGR